MSNVTLTDAKELETWLWSVRYAISALFIVLLPGRLYQLQQRPVNVRSNSRQYLKLVFSLFSGLPRFGESGRVLTLSLGHNDFVLRPTTFYGVCPDIEIRGH